MSAAPDNFYVTGGTLRHDASCYIERRADRELFDGLCQGEFCYLLTSRQMGKSSLMAWAGIYGTLFFHPVRIDSDVSRRRGGSRLMHHGRGLP